MLIKYREEIFRDQKRTHRNEKHSILSSRRGRSHPKKRVKDTDTGNRKVGKLEDHSREC